MSKIFIINGHQPYPFSKGELNAAFIDRAETFFADQGHEVRMTHVAEDYNAEQEVANHQWADIVLMQFPVNWMGVSWSFKKYMDDVYSAGMDGRLCAGDGRTTEAPKANYGMGGTLTGTSYMISATLNAPAEAFNDPSEPFFEGMSLDDLLRPVHLNAKFFGMKPLPSFAAFDVMKNPEIENDFKRFDAHLADVFAKEPAHV
ncbi:NAD(P)H-dependent oxidoreductase [Alterisphingorhabdus coralli]|uniref:NAD(P)H-dependent oxidoreductase n=1 Tax=Alterisphingorhabdus coralli TaxID=3071408 RepID=A0AA97F7D5_9SPHN|nr:NAD(P)H-dependent oxidoreductase [Parasphingorhabdus sp. SCSIO 66989]WOE73885.1 NAD(P)H-dependent oxidoreductase [Parasphingorhabdus sp. SCSIO 66989]